MQKFLHVGCGHNKKDRTTRVFSGNDWQEVRFDIDESVGPDLIGTILDMETVDTASVDAVYSSHNIEHVYPHEVPLALNEFYRVLKPSGYLVVTCPNLQAVCEFVSQDKLTEPIYNSPAGPISPIDILYGLRPALARGNHYMAHKCGFTEKVLVGTMRNSGFRSVASRKRGIPFVDLWAIGTKQEVPDEAIHALAMGHFPT